MRRPDDIIATRDSLDSPVMQGIPVSFPEAGDSPGDGLALTWDGRPEIRLSSEKLGGSTQNAHPDRHPPPTRGSPGAANI
jgi:hypothetical protein